jgi:hypothetical protein
MLLNKTFVLENNIYDELEAIIPTQEKGINLQFVLPHVMHLPRPNFFYIG